MATPATALLPAQEATAPENTDVLPLQGEVPAEQAEGAQNPKSPLQQQRLAGPTHGTPCCAHDGIPRQSTSSQPRANLNRGPTSP